MRRLVITLTVLGALAGPAAGVAAAGTVCDLQQKLGIDNVKECEDYWP